MKREDAFSHLIGLFSNELDVGLYRVMRIDEAEKQEAAEFGDTHERYSTQTNLNRFRGLLNPCEGLHVVQHMCDHYKKLKTC